MGTIKTTNIQTITGSGTLTLGTSGETITIPSGVTITNNGTQTGFGGTNTPAFLANPSTNYSISVETQTKVTLDTEVYDTHSAFSSSRFTVPSGQGGKYNFYWNVSVAAGDNNLHRLHSILYKNGNIHFYGGYTDWTNQAYRNLDNRNGSVAVSASAGDYFEIYAYIQGAGSPVYIGYSGAVGGVYAPVTYFGGYKLVE